MSADPLSRLPRLSVTVSPAMAQAIADEASRQGVTTAEIIRSGIQLELTIRQTTATVVGNVHASLIAAEVHRRAEAARRLAAAVAQLSRTRSPGRVRMSDVAASGRRPPVRPVREETP